MAKMLCLFERSKARGCVIILSIRIHRGDNSQETFILHRKKLHFVKIRSIIRKIVYRYERNIRNYESYKEPLTVVAAISCSLQVRSSWCFVHFCHSEFLYKNFPRSRIRIHYSGHFEKFLVYLQIYYSIGPWKHYRLLRIRHQSNNIYF